MNKIIQLRGSNAVGKTTAVKEFVKAHKMIITTVDINGTTTHITHDIKKEIIVLGRYDVLNGGCDRFKNKRHVIETIVFLIKEYKPKVIIFEGFIYGKTFKMACDIEKLSKIYGYQYIPITLYRSPQKALELLYSRNGKEKINEKTFYECYKSNLSSFKKIKAVGISIKLYNTDNIQKNHMKEIIEENI